MFTKKRFVLVLFAVLGVFASPAAEAQSRGFQTYFLGFADASGNGLIDCGERLSFETCWSDTFSPPSWGAYSGQIEAPLATVGLNYVPGSVRVDAGNFHGLCYPQVAVSAKDEFLGTFLCSPPAQSPTRNGNSVCFIYDALYTGVVPSASFQASNRTSNGVVQPQAWSKADHFGRGCVARKNQ